MNIKHDSNAETTTKLHSFWPAAIILLPVALLTGNLAGLWIGRHTSGHDVFATMTRETDAFMEPLDPLGIAKMLRTAMEAELNGK